MRKTIRCLLSMALVAVVILTCTMFAFAAEDSGSEAGVALNTATETTYDDVTEALAAASEGDTITLHQDASAMLVSVTNGVTLDLNGHTLEASYVTCFGDIVDNCKDGNGLLKVAEKRFLIQNRNEQLPIKAESGYTFVEVEKFNTAYQSEKSRYAFQPFIAAKGHELLAGGFDATGVTVNVRVSWNQGDGNRYQDFVYNDQMVTKFLSSYSAAGNKYGQMFTLVLNGAENFEQLTYEAVVTSETGVEIASQPTVVLNKDGNVETDENNQVTEDLTIENGEASATVAAGTQLDAGAKNLELSVKEMDVTTGDIELEDTEEIISVDVHVDGVSKDNTVPIIVTLKEFAPEYMNKGNINLYHVEGDQTVKMTRVYSISEVDEHNEFYYDTLTGTVTMALASFSEVAAVADTENAWEGNFDYSWYTNAVAPADGEAVTEYKIANADQLAAFGAIVGGMNGQKQDDFNGKTVKLLTDINLGDKESENNPDLIFYPIGYYNNTGSYEKASGGSVTSSVSSFEGTFDGNGHTVSNFYQNTWEMFGDYNDGYSGTPNHYKDAMGLFGYVLNGTVKNLTVENFKSDGEYTPTGVIAAYADGNSTFENITITDCNPRVYNTGNGGIIGIAGDTSTANDDHITLKNITVDNTNVISALWGSWDVACGGLVGMYRGNVDGSGNATGDTISFENCHVSAQIDVNNDVCSNYQYYAYRYAGMIIGSVRHNTKNAEGKTIPNMTGISAKDCTVNYGDWNDYYYCEFEKNSLASYSEDYQFSRVPHSELEFTDSNGNGVVDADERASVTGCKHDHTEEENHQAIYLPFHQLFTGYSWGVSSIGLKEYSGIVTDLGITEGDQQESVEKFEAIDSKTEVSNNIAIKASELFSYNENCGVEVDKNSFYIGITDLDYSDGVVTAEFNRAEDWKDSTIILNGTGKIKITAQDYNFCKPCTVEVTVTERQPEVKFTKKFDKDFLYRVGNASGSTVTLGTLFDGVESVRSEKVKVSFENIAGNANGAYTPNATWKNGTIQFSGTGVVKVTITDDDYCIPTELTLEVVNATNLTSAKGTITGENFVLLCDVNTSTYVNYWNCALYGNGFTYSLKGAPTTYDSKQGHGILITKNATLDNLVIVGDVYDGYGAYTDQEYYNAVIDIQEPTVIQNCHISGCSTPVLARANVNITDTTLYGGTVGNLIIKAGKATLENVTTANYADGRKLVGMGIVIHSDANETAKLEFKGENPLKQYNFYSEKNEVSNNVYASNIYSVIFDDSCKAFHFGNKPDRYANTGIISMVETFTKEDIEGSVAGYDYKYVTPSTVGKTLLVYTQPNTVGSVDNNYVESMDTHKSTVQGDYLPTFEYDLGNQEISYDGSDDTRYLYKKDDGIVGLYQDGDQPLTLDLTKLATIVKYGEDRYDVNVSCRDSDGKILPATNDIVTLEKAGDYTLEFSINDNIFYNSNGQLIDKTVPRTFTVPLSVSVKAATIKNAEVSITKTAIDGVYTTVNLNDYKLRINFLECISVKDYDKAGAGKTVDLATNIKEVTLTPSGANVFSSAFTITIDYNDGRALIVNLSKISGSSAGTKTASVNTSGGVYFITDGALNNKPTDANGQNKCTITSVSFKGNNSATVTNDTDVAITWPIESSGGSQTCLAEGTLITTSDGSKRKVEDLRKGDSVMAFDHTTGEIVNNDVIIVVRTESEHYENTFVFDDGSELVTINEHGLYDLNLYRYVNISDENADEFIGHDFVSVDKNGNISTKKLVDVVSEYKSGYKYDIVTEHTLNYIAEDTLSVTHVLVDVINSFDFDDNMLYDAEKMQADIEKYGLYTYEEWETYADKSVFDQYNIPVMKVGISKGLYTKEYIIDLINTYVLDDSVQIVNL